MRYGLPYDSSCSYWVNGNNDNGKMAENIIKLTTIRSTKIRTEQVFC